MQGGGELRGAGTQGEEPDAAIIQFGQLLLGGDLGVEDQQPRVAARNLLPVVGEGEHLVGLAGLGQVGVGVEQGVAVGVLGEERQDAAGALGTARHVVLFQRRVLTPVHHRVKVQVDLLPGGQPGGQGRFVQRGQEALLLGVLEPVGVGGQRGGLGQRDQPGEQRRPGVGGQVLHVGDPAHPDQLERQQRQQIAGGGDLRRRRVAGRLHQRGQVQGEQVRDGQQQPGHPGLGLPGQRGEVDHLRTRQRFPARAAPLHLRAAPQPGQPLGGDHLGDPGAVERGPFLGQREADLVDRVPRRAQLQDPFSGGLLGRRGLRARPAGAEKLPLPGAEVTHQRLHRGGRVPEPVRHLGRRQAVEQIGAQRLIAALGQVLRPGEELAAAPRRLNDCHWLGCFR